MSNSLILATKSDEEKLNVFKTRLLALYDCDEQTLKLLFKPRSSDPLFICYDKNFSNCALSFDGEKWKRNSIVNFELDNPYPIPARGSYWKSTKSFQFFIIIDFVNLRSPNIKVEQPSVVYMDSTGNSKTMEIYKWFQEMIGYDKKLF